MKPYCTLHADIGIRQTMIPPNLQINNFKTAKWNPQFENKDLTLRERGVIEENEISTWQWIKANSTSTQDDKQEKCMTLICQEITTKTKTQKTNENKKKMKTEIDDANLPSNNYNDSNTKDRKNIYSIS